MHYASAPVTVPADPLASTASQRTDSWSQHLPCGSASVVGMYEATGKFIRVSSSESRSRFIIYSRIKGWAVIAICWVVHQAVAFVSEMPTWSSDCSWLLWPATVASWRRGVFVRVKGAGESIHSGGPAPAKILGPRVKLEVQGKAL